MAILILEYRNIVTTAKPRMESLMVISFAFPELYCDRVSALEENL